MMDDQPEVVTASRLRIRVSGPVGCERPVTSFTFDKPDEFVRDRLRLQQCLVFPKLVFRELFDYFFVTALAGVRQARDPPKRSSLRHCDKPSL
jgi:hypothetical protein